MRIELKGLNTFLAKTQKQRAVIKSTAGSFVQEKTRQILRTLVLNSPQFSGNTAASWTVHTYASKVSEDAGLARLDWKATPEADRRWIGNTDAWKTAIKRNEAAIKSIRYNTDVRIVNNAKIAAELATDPTAESWLRPGNFIPGDVMAVKLALAKAKNGTFEVG